jgi:hypothetical protein
VKKIAVLGSGTAGCLSVSHYKRYTNYEIEWIYDTNTKAVPVGEGSLFNFPTILSKVGFTYSDLDAINGTPKLGIRKENWGSQVGILHEDFEFGHVAAHFSANELQKYLLNFFKNDVTVSDRFISNYDQVDADYIIDCRGFPKQYNDDYILSDCIAVNTAYVTQCYWDYPKFLRTLTIARPWGWVFGIPLKNRCAIGYLFNKDITNIEVVKEDVKVVFEQFNLIPSNTTLTMPFTSFYKKETFKDRVAYNGNSSFFLEPLEATSIYHMETIIRASFDVCHERLTHDTANSTVLKKIKEIENIIMLHYFNGSKYKTEFWDFASARAEKTIIEAIKTKKFKEFFKNGMTFNRYTEYSKDTEYGSWSVPILNQNLQSFMQTDKLINLMDNYE